ncbi:DUF2975 domain-containing protein [Sphingomicrobium flavum]|uniref:DUF2975 domain-containing protein n=1 Tax=Sphingomicrobium flavum TaxID=1229164 RepID=UPI0021ADB243|nr:DUF2975 domain-containing protein [Sphingomicrobium flavum]
MAEKSRWLASATLMVLIAVILLFTAQVLGADYVGRKDPYFFASLLPMPLYVFAIGAVWRALLAVSQGGRTGILGKLLRRVGIALFVGGLLEVFGVALLSQLMGAGGPLFSYDVTAITIGVIGAGLTIIARLLDEADELRKELDEFV